MIPGFHITPSLCWSNVIEPHQPQRRRSFHQPHKNELSWWNLHRLCCQKMASISWRLEVFKASSIFFLKNLTCLSTRSYLESVYVCVCANSKRSGFEASIDVVFYCCRRTCNWKKEAFDFECSLKKTYIYGKIKTKLFSEISEVMLLKLGSQGLCFK